MTASASWVAAFTCEAERRQLTAMALLRPLIRFADQESLHPDLGRALRATVAFMVPLVAAHAGWLGHDATLMCIAAARTSRWSTCGAPTVSGSASSPP